VLARLAYQSSPRSRGGRDQGLRDAQDCANALTATTFWKDARSFGSTLLLVTSCTPAPFPSAPRMARIARLARLQPGVALSLHHSVHKYTQSIAVSLRREGFASSHCLSSTIFVCIHINLQLPVSSEMERNQHEASALTQHLRHATLQLNLLQCIGPSYNFTSLLDRPILGNHSVAKA